MAMTREQAQSLLPHIENAIDEAPAFAEDMHIWETAYAIADVLEPREPHCPTYAPAQSNQVPSLDDCYPLDSLRS